MYTECPQCQTAFRVTAALLRQAHGQVQCGGCGNRFDALENLTEEAPVRGISSSQSVRAFEQRSQELLKSLGELTSGDEVRIEDTGIEWRVLDMDGVNDDAGDESADDDAGQQAADSHAATPDGAADDADHRVAAEDDDWANLGVDGLEVTESPADSESVELAASADDTAIESQDDPADEVGAAAEDTPQAAFDLQAAAVDDRAEEAPEEQLRFDDNTPLPDEYFRPVVIDDDQAAADVVDEPDDAEDTEDAAVAAAETLRVSIDTGTEADWQDLLTEVDDTDQDDDPAQEMNPDDEAAPAADPVAAEDTDATLDDEPREVSATSSEQPDWSTAEAVEMTGDDLPSDSDSETETAAAENTASKPVRQTAARALDDDDTDDALVESIVMEGDTVTDLLEMAERASYDDVPPPDLEEAAGPDTGFAGRHRKLLRIVGFAAVLALGVTLLAQYVHANRESLATKPLFQSTAAPVYEAIGKPVAPAWDIGGWQFESTTGSTDDTDQHLTIYSRIANESSTTLPYPLIHVSLTDRWDEVIGSRVLAPAEYLAGSGSVAQQVAAGASFTAVITVASPDAAATGFKLNVCYGLPDRRLRCAIEDFRD